MELRSYFKAEERSCACAQSSNPSPSCISILLRKDCTLTPSGYPGLERGPQFGAGDFNVGFDCSSPGWGVGGGGEGISL